MNVDCFDRIINIIATIGTAGSAIAAVWLGLRGDRYVFFYVYVELLWRWLCKVRFGGGGMIIIFIWYVEKASGEKRLFPLLSINIIPKIQDEIEFWVVSSFTPN